jgi:hypothetical protein
MRTISFSRIVVILALSFFSEKALADDLVAAVLPLSRSPTVGQTATAFATVINSSGRALTGCTASLPGFAGTFSYRTTNASTNAVVGGVNQPFPLAIGGAQTLVVVLTQPTVLPPTDEALVFQCTGSTPAASIIGVNTLLLSASALPTADIIALVATPSADGTVRMAGAGSPQAFSVATVNVGATAPITVSADMGDISLPLTITLCQTNPSTGQCLSAPTATVTTTINQNATPTFSLFVTPQAAIPFFPSIVRLSVKFKDGSGATRGSTSVALSTGSTLAVNQTAGGYYVGTFRGTSGQSLGSNGQVEFLIAEDGEMRGASFDSVHVNDITALFSTQANPSNALLYSSTGTIISSEGYTLSDNTASAPLSISGALSPRNLIAGLYSYHNETGQIYAAYNAGRYERPSSLATVSGNWTLRGDNDITDGSVQISSVGVLTGSSLDHCAYNGAVSTINTSYNAYRVSVTVTNCGADNGTYTGLGTMFDIRSANDSFRLVLSSSTSHAVTRYMTRY